MWFFAQEKRDLLLTGNLIFCFGLLPYLVYMQVFASLFCVSLIVVYCLYQLFLKHRIHVFYKHQDSLVLSAICIMGVAVLYSGPLDVIAALAFILGRAGESVNKEPQTRFLYISGALLWMTFGIYHGMWSNVLAQAVFSTTIAYGILKYNDISYWKSGVMAQAKT
tara:strand:+ start:807 stop:1301 length:495 start_codon:yes stop_codon:yes gene_type:complete